MIGQTLGPYRILDEVARGGQATLHRAEHTVLGRTTALKVLHPHLITVADFLEKFEAESKILAKLSHPNIVAVYDAGVDQGQYWIAMEWLAGQTVAELIAQQGKLPVDQAVRIADQVAAALEYAHGQGLIHRDIKPSNIMLLPDDTVKVLDFGIAAIVAAGQKAKTRIGTVEYMSYEQFQGQADHRSDLYSLGASLYEMLTGQLPPRLGIDAPTPPRQLNPDIPEGLEQLLYRVLAPQPESRPQTSPQFQQELQASLTGPVATHSNPPGEHCPQCGSANRVGAMYCRQCGSKLATIPPRISIGKKLLTTASEWLITEESNFTPQFAWSPSGHALAWTSQRSGDTLVQVADEFRVVRKDVKTRTIARGVADDASLKWVQDGATVVTISPEEADKVWSPDGKRCAFIRGSSLVVAEGEDQSTVVELPRKGGGSIIGWTADSLWIVYRPFYQTDNVMYRVDLKGAREFVMGFPDFEAFPLFQEAMDLRGNLLACGERVLYILDVITGQIEFLESTRAAGASLTKESFRRMITHAQWFHEGSKILFVREKEISVVNVDDTGLQRLAEGYAPQWSPDGRHIAFLRSPEQGKYELWVMRVEPA